MKKPTHVNILGVEIPLATLAQATWDVPIYATLGEWNNYYSEGTADILEAMNQQDYEQLKESLKAEQTVFEDVASRECKLPIAAGINRQFFNYKTLSDLAYEGSI